MSTGKPSPGLQHELYEDTAVDATTAPRPMGRLRRALGKLPKRTKKPKHKRRSKR